MRNIYMKEPIALVFDHAPQQAFDTYSYIYGLEVNVGEYTMSNFQLVLAMIAFGLIFYGLSIIKLRKTKLS